MSVINMGSSNLEASHLAWCGLVALHIARKDGIVSSPAQENLFLVRWLATAEKQSRFRKELAEDIRWLLTEGREKGVNADLNGHLEYLWCASKGDLLDHSDLYRLRHAFRAIKLAGCIFSVLDEAQWHKVKNPQANSANLVIHINRQSLEAGFNKEEKQITPVKAKIAGNLAVVDVLLEQAGWMREIDKADSSLHTFITRFNLSK